MAEILVLDDVVDAAVLVSKILGKKGHAVHSFNDETDALRYVEEHEVDLVILDIKLKEMSGVEVLSRMKQIRPQVRAIMLTGYPTVETAREAISLGAEEYCVKPIDRQELEDKVEKVLKNKNKKSALHI